MAQVVDPAVAVTVDQAGGAVQVPDERPLAAAHDEVDAGGLEESGFAGGDVLGEEVEGCGFG